MGWIARGLGAVVLTGVVSALIVALASGLVMGNPERGTVTGPNGFISAVTFAWFFGAIVATFYAAIIGVLVEWPKTRWLASRASGGLLPELIISVVVSLAVLLGIGVLQLNGEADQLESLSFLSACAVAGGVCSALFWWWLVVVPLRRSKA
jgi:hypothetical protein